jgi:hypothetical protein
MSFLGKPFQHDLFVSYSHGAFAGRHDADLKLWSQKFADDLRAELAGTTEFEKISVFLDEGDRSDENVDRTEQLTGLLHDRVAGSALFTLLMTPHYLRSKWCRQELDWWCEKHHPDTLGAGSRAYVCGLRPTDKAAWPTTIADVVGYYFYDRDKKPDKARPFTWRGSTLDHDKYVARLIDVSGEMMGRLRDIKKILDEQWRREEQARNYAKPEGQILFLHGRPHAAAAWDQACDRLLDAGFYIVPDRPVPLAANGGLEPEYQTQLATSDGVLLLGTEDGPAIDTDIIVIGRHFRNLAAAAKPFMPCAVLNAAGEPLRTSRRLRNTKNLRMGWIDSTIDDWPVQVRSWLLDVTAQIELVA